MPSQNSNSRKKRRDHVKAQPTVPPVAFPASMSQAEMQHIIANAIIEAKKADEDAKQKQKEANIRELQEAIGFKKYNDKNRLLRIIKIAINEFKCIFKICVLPRKNIKGDRVTFSIMSVLLTLIFALVALVLYCAALLFLICGIIALIHGQGAPLWGIEWYIFIPFSFAAFLFASIFRISSIEIEKVEDRDYIQSLLNIVLTIIAAVFAYLSLIKE